MSFTALRRPLAALLAIVALATAALAAIAPAAAQSPSALPGAPTFAVTAMDFHFDGLPTSVPEGTALTMVNAGSEAHELLIARRNDGVTESWDELLALPQDQLVTKLTAVGALVAGPGEPAELAIVLYEAGDYIALCFVPQGMTSVPAPGATLDPALVDALPHVALGMRQEFTVTAAGSTPGPLPSAAASHHEPVARTIELEMTATLQYVQDGAPVTSIPVTVGETITFKVTNTAGFAHNLWIGPDAALASAQTDGLPGLPEFSEGTQEFTWTVPADAASLKFGCTVPGHYQIMQGTFTVEG